MLTPSPKKLAASISIALVALLTVAVILVMLAEQRHSVWIPARIETHH
jgi:hypothetical protein